MSDPIDAMYAAPKDPRDAATDALPTGKDVTGWSLLAIPPITGIISGAVIGSGAETIVGVAMIVACVFVGRADARRWGFRSPAIGMALLFLVFYPVHFYRRAKLGAPLGLVAGIAALFLWLALMIVVIMIRGVQVK